MATQAPLTYIAGYYDSVQKKNAAFPEVAEFWLSGFRHVTGKKVLNLGCGPMLYDNMLRFGEMPETYVGLDLNAASFEFLENSDHPALVEARTKAEALCPDIQFIAGDVFDHMAKLEGQFDTVLGIGFFGTFEGQLFDDLVAATHQMLKPDGQLLKMTWHGAQRTARETEDKLKYRYDNEIEPPAEELVRLIEAQGFSLSINDILDCPPDTVGWEKIQVATFNKQA